MKKFTIVLAMTFAIALLAQPKAQAGVFVRFGLPIPVPVPVFYGPAYYPGGYYYGPYGYAHYQRPYSPLTCTNQTVPYGAALLGMAQSQALRAKAPSGHCGLDAPDPWPEVAKNT